MTALPSPTPYLQAFVDGTIGWLVLNRPERRNALNADMWSAIPQLINSLDANLDVRVIVIRGAGHEAFAAGADISEFGENRNSAEAARAYEDLNGAALASVRRTASPVIALIQGFCIGGGLALTLACDLRLADETAVFALPPARLGLAYPLDGLSDLVSAIGASAAKDLLFTARRINAAEALALGLINRIAGNAEAETRELCNTIVAGAPLSITHAKHAIGLLTSRPGHAAASEVAAMSARCFNSLDYSEGRKAFAEKRRPNFIGS